MNIALIGFGAVAQGLAEILDTRASDLYRDYQFRPRVVAAATRAHGTLYQPDGLDIPLLLDAIKAGHLDGYPDSAGLYRGWNAEQIVRESSADVIVEASPSNLETAQPALDTCLAALASGRHVVLANKGPVALAYRDLADAARRGGRLLRFEATVMAGTPTLRLGMQALAGCRLQEVRGILNGTTNYILTEMETGLPFETALAQAQKLGYAERDPSADVDGWDAAGKALILAAALFGARLKMGDMDVTGIAGITPDQMHDSRRDGRRWKLIARVTPAGGSVQPTLIPFSDPLAAIGGTTNAITFVTDLLGEVTLVGPGAGRLQSGFALLADLLDIHRLGMKNSSIL